MEDDILSDFVTTEDLKRCEELYNQECRTGAASRNTKFSYACCLVRSKYPADVRKGIQLFEIMYKDGSTEEEKRHCLYYMALGHAKKKDFCESLNLCESFLKVEPNNKQVKDLETAVRKRVKKDGLEGLAMAGSAALVVGGLVGLGLALASKKKSSSSSS